jgi:hypothetical protein
MPVLTTQSRYLLRASSRVAPTAISCSLWNAAQHLLPLRLMDSPYGTDDAATLRIDSSGQLMNERTRAHACDYSGIRLTMAVRPTRILRAELLGWKKYTTVECSLSAATITGAGIKFPSMDFLVASLLPQSKSALGNAPALVIVQYQTKRQRISL